MDINTKPAEARGPETMQGKPCVLIVDDSNSLRTYLENLFRETGFEVVSAPDGREALERIEKNNPDVVLLDIEMPVMTGLEVLDALSGKRRLYSIILLTSISDTKNRIKGLDKGADDYITKPFDEGELIARVRAAARTVKIKKQLELDSRESRTTLQDLFDSYNTQVEKEKVHSVAKLASGIAHEINNPLSFIKSNIGVVRKYSGILNEYIGNFIDADNNSSDAVASAAQKKLLSLRRPKIDYILNDMPEVIAELTQGVDRISSIIRYLLIMDNAGFQSQCRAEDLNTIITIALDNISKSPVCQDRTLDVRLSGNPIRVPTNADQLITALEQVLGNAVDFTSHDGKIQVSTCARDDWAYIEIHDSGEGIPADCIGNVFDPFYTTRREMNNLGLGLTIARHLIHGLGGTIDIVSHKGEGTSVTVNLPLERSQNKDPNTHSLYRTSGEL